MNVNQQSLTQHHLFTRRSPEMFSKVSIRAYFYEHWRLKTKIFRRDEKTSEQRKKNFSHISSTNSLLWSIFFFNFKYGDFPSEKNHAKQIQLADRFWHARCSKIALHNLCVNTRNYPLLMLVFDVVEILFLEAVEEFLGTIRWFVSLVTCFCSIFSLKILLYIFY